jgi:phosphoribosyl-AMP cyclohydrolase
MRNVSFTTFRTGFMPDTWLSTINWSDDGLVPVIAQEAGSGKVLMVAWMNRDAVKLTVETGRAVYWSRSRKKLWHKGEESGHVQKVKDIYLDCDEDVLLLTVEQIGGIACHTGRHNCFFKKLENGRWMVTTPVIKDPKEIYHK